MIRLTEAGHQDSKHEANQTNETIGPIAKKAQPSPLLSHNTTLRSISKMLQRESSHVGVLIRTPQGGYLPIYRDRMFVCLAKPYAKDLYYDRPILEFAKQHHPQPPLMLPCTTSVSDAIEYAVTREPESRYDPIMVDIFGDLPPLILDVRLLLEKQRELLGAALSQVEEQRHKALVASLHDKLTGLPNRDNAMAHLGKMSRDHAADTSRDFAVLFLDYDRFKLINDSLGHDAGDELLIQISKRLKQTLSDSTGIDESQMKWKTARLGGDEFLVLIDQIAHTQEATAIAQAILDAMRPTFAIRGHSVSSLPSIGIATSCSSDGTCPASMVRDADAAMYRAKSQGRARYALFDQSLQEESFQRLYIESQLRGALDQDELSAYYQPIVNCESGQVAGFEALIRWTHPELGTVSPAQFIPIAEECGVISGIGRFMLETAIHQLAQWNNRANAGPPLYMSINVSKRQLLQPDCVDHLARTIEQAGVAPEQIYLEITESVVIGHGDTVVDILKSFKDLGVRLSMDDFGTGLSSLTHLHQYPMDVLKIDQAFVKHLEEKSIYTAVILAIVTLAKNLNMSIVVEGIERVEQLVQIQTLDCEYAQGYLFSKPVPADEAVKLLQPKTAEHQRGQVA
ncbi:MAG: EAL domain-containing protein [Phycisphaeraceae bacterium]|nr:EAL domain-containing protein [Phycisphaeraceae bacterium]